MTEPPRQVPPRRGSQAQRERAHQAEQWHVSLVSMNEVRSRMLTEKIAVLTAKQDAIKAVVVRAMAETSAVETFVENLWDAQRQLSADLKKGFVHEEQAIDWENDDQMDANARDKNDSGTVSSSTAASVSTSVGVTATTIAAACMQKSSRIMISKIQSLGIDTLQEVLERLRRISKTLTEQHNDLQHVGRTALKALQESQVKVKEAWEKYLEDVSPSTESRDSKQQRSSERHGGSPPTRSLKRKSSFKRGLVEDDSTSASRGLGKRSSHKTRDTDIRESTQGVETPKRTLSRNNSLKVMSNAADLANSLPTTDVWLSEWSYRAHVMEQVNLWEGATRRMQQLFHNIQETEVMRRLHLRQDLITIVSNQQKLAVNLEAASAVGLMDYWEKQQLADQAAEEKDSISEDSSTDIPKVSIRTTKVFSASGKRLTNDALSSSLTLPSLTKSGFVSLTTLVKRSDKEAAHSTLSMIVLTTDGLLYFFDLPNDSNISFSSSTSLTQAWEAVLAAEFKRKLTTNTSKRGSDFVIIVPPPMPTSRFVLAQCSVEMASEDCVAHFNVPESIGEGFRMEFISAHMQIAFIDAFHASKFQDDNADVATDTEGSENVEDTEYETSNNNEEDSEREEDNGSSEEESIEQESSSEEQEQTDSSQNSGDSKA